MINKLINTLSKCNFDELKNKQKLQSLLLNDNFNIEYIIYGNNKIVFKIENIDCVIKIPIRNSKENYINEIGKEANLKPINFCDLECDMYDIAKHYNVEQFYAPLIKINIKDKNYIYLQEEVLIFEDLIKKISLNNCKENINYMNNFLIEKNYINNFFYMTNEFLLWLYCILQKNGEQKLIDFLNFFTMNYFFPQDIHSKNIGLTKTGQPVLIDY